MAVLILTILIASIFILYFHFTKYNKYWKAKCVVGPEPKFFFGNIKEYVLRRKPIFIVFKEIYDMYPEEKVIGMFLMRSPELLIRDLDIVKNILIKDFDIFVDRGLEFGDNGLGSNLFHAEGDTWRVLHSHFTPLFTSAKLNNMMYLVIERANVFLDYLDQVTQSSPVQEVHKLVQKYTQATIAVCAFGLDIDTFNKEHEKLCRIDQKIFNTNRARDIELMYPGILKKFGGSLFPKDIKDFFYGLAKNVIAQRNGEPTNRNDFMDLLLALKKNKRIYGKRKNDQEEKQLDVNDQLIAAQAFVFYAAGYESSASTTAFLLYQLALNPDIQDRIVKEIEEMLERHGRFLTLQAISELSYMSKVFDETLRMYPVLADLRRKSSSTYKIPGTDITIEKGQLVKISVLGIHYDEKIYPNPEVFDPERFSPENIAARHSAAYLPFGLGPRNCIGMRFAQVQSRVCLVKLLTRYRVEATDATPVHFQYDPGRVILFPKGGLPLKFVKRC